MFLIPIVCRKRVETASGVIYQCWLLLERNGTYCIAGDDAIAFATENGLDLEGIFTIGECVLMAVKPTPALLDFYSWAEVPQTQQPMRECWRSFLWSVPNVGMNDGLKEIEIGPGSVHAVLQTYFQAGAV